MPRATEADCRAVREIKPRRGVIFTKAFKFLNAFAVVQQSAGHANDRLIENPKRRIHQMNPKVHHAAAARLIPIVEPGFLRAIRIMEDQVYCKNFSKRILPNELANLLQCLGVTIRKIDAKKAIGGPREVDDLRNLPAITT